MRRTRPDPTTKVQAAATQRVGLTLEPGKLPRLTVTDAKGTTTHKAVGLHELLTILDRSAVLDALNDEATRTISLPPLPERTLMVRTTEDPGGTTHELTGWLPAGTWGLAFGEAVHAIALPPIAWRASWRDGRMPSLAVALVGGSGDPTLDSPLYRWPFSNVYSGTSYMPAGNVCWPSMREVELRMSEIPRKGVGGFLSVRNNADLFGRGRTQNSEYEGYAEFLEACARDGLREEWLIPMNLNLRGFHDERQ